MQGFKGEGVVFGVWVWFQGLALRLGFRVRVMGNESGAAPT